MRGKQNSRAWWIFAACLGMSAGGIGLFMNCTGLIFSEIIEEFGFHSGDLSIYFTIRFLTQALVVGLVTRMILKRPKLGITVVALSGFLNFALMSCYSRLWHWYISAVLAGIAMCSIFVVTPIIINNWFRKYNGLLIGLVMSASGASGAVFSPIVSFLVTGLGWRMAATILGGAGALLTLFPALFVIAVTPEEMGLKPFGYKEDAKEEKRETRSGKASRVPVYIFVLMTVTIIISVICGQFVNQIPQFALSIQYTLAAGAAMNSSCQMGNLLGKIIFGTLSDRIGLIRSVFAFILLSLSAYILLLFGQSSLLLLCCGCCFFGMSFSLGTTAPPLVFYYVYGPEAYKQKMTRFQSVNNVVTALLASMIPYVYDFTGSFTPVFEIAMGGALLGMAGYYGISKYKRKTMEVSWKRKLAN